ncbi:MAG: GNAT family N-acetyltransferase [Lachnospiraceae bacterium]|nr:GNAT family N-acetyltransferase [Lachnospiraceae bacterium]
MFRIERATAKDADAVLELLVQVNRVHAEGRPDLFRLGTKYNREELLSIFSDDLSPVFVYKNEDGQVLGHAFCIFMTHPNDNILTDIKTLYIDDICVDEAARGQHVGAALYAHVTKFAKKSGCYNITLNVWNCNPGAMKFYESLGLVPYKVGMEQIL